jgi:hypothetical protein
MIVLDDQQRTPLKAAQAQFNARRVPGESIGQSSSEESPPPPYTPPSTRTSAAFEQGMHSPGPSAVPYYGSTAPVWSADQAERRRIRLRRRRTRLGKSLRLVATTVGIWLLMFFIGAKLNVNSQLLRRSSD